MTKDLTKCHYIEDENLWITCRGRMSFVALAKKYRSKDAKAGDEGQFAVTIVTPPTAILTNLMKAASEAAHEKVPGVAFEAAPPKLKGLKTPFLDAAEKMEDGVSSWFGEDGLQPKNEEGLDCSLAGWKMIRANSYSRRPVVRMPNGSELALDEFDAEVYSGRWARIQVRPKYYTYDGNKGVKFYLEGVQLLRNDSRLGTGGGSKGEAFSAVDDEDDDADSAMG